jgi:hypothetical protein
VLIECKNCGAPLDVKQGDTFARCCYCGKAQRVRTSKTMVQQTPAQWQPPPQWTPPPQFRARSVPLKLDASKSLRKLVIIIVAFAVITGILPIVCTVMAVVGSAASAVAGSDDDAPSRTPSKSKPADPKASDDSASSAGANKVCKRAKACCLIAMQGQDTTACGQIAALNDPKVCKQSLDGFRSLAVTKGKRCK